MPTAMSLDASTEAQTGPWNPVVCVVDDDAPLRRSLAFLLEAAQFRVRTFGSAAEFLQAWDPQLMGCLLVDVRMPDMDGLELQAELSRRGATIPTIFITGHGDVPLAVRAMQLGAFHFFEKPIPDEQLIERIKTALELAQEQHSRGGGHLEFVRRKNSLSHRERQVLALVIEGHTSVEIAPQLKVSPKTVEVHRANIMRKMGAQTVAHLVRMVLTETVDSAL